MLIGSYLGSLSEKRRIAVPKKFLTELGEKPIVAKWYEDCLILVDNDFWDRLYKRISGDQKIVNLGIREIERFILGSAFELEPDEQGRVVLPEVLVTYANLGNEVIFLGLSDRVEIWNKEIWETRVNKLEKVTKEYIENINKK